MHEDRVVPLPRPMTGEELAKAVRAATEDYPYGSLVCERYADGTCELGQNSGYQHEKILVMGNDEEERIELGRTYESVVLTEGLWEGGFDGGAGDPDQAMEGFRARLLAACA